MSESSRPVSSNKSRISYNSMRLKRNRNQAPLTSEEEGADKPLKKFSAIPGDIAHPTPPQNVKIKNEHYKEFAAKALTEYDDLLTDLQAWCRFEAEEHYSQANWFERKSFYMEVFATTLGSVSITAVLGFMTEWVSNGSSASLDSLWSRIGLVGCGGVLIAGVLEFLGKGSASLLPTFQKRAQDHTNNAFNWQFLKHEIKSSRILLRAPNVDVSSVDDMYKKYIERRQTLSKEVLVFTEDQNPALEECMTYETEFLSDWPVAEKYAVKQHVAVKELGAVAGVATPYVEAKKAN